MKKLTFTLLFLLGAIGTLSAQSTVKSDIFAFLGGEGYVPSYDQDGDISVKIQGISYYVIVQDLSSENSSYVEMKASFSTDTPLAKLLAISNDFNRNKYLCKCSAYSDDEQNIFTVSMEFISDNSANTLFQMRHALRLLPGWIDEFTARLD